MNANRILGFIEWGLLFFLAALILSFGFAQIVLAEDSGWLVKQKNASPNGQWILREDGAVNLIPSALEEGKDSSFVPPGFDNGKKVGWSKREGSADLAIGNRQGDPALAIGHREGDPALAMGHREGDPALALGDRKGDPSKAIGNRVGDPALAIGHREGDPALALGHRAGDPSKAVGNRGKPEMFDPYGKSKDDRLETCGNRGRPTRDCEMVSEEPAPEPTPEPAPEPAPVVEPAPVEEPATEEPVVKEYPDQLYTDSWTFWILKYAADQGINPYFWLIELSGYSPLEAQFLMQHTMEQVYDAYSVTGEEDFLRTLIIDNSSYDMYTENLIADFQTYGSLAPAAPLTEEEMAAIIAYVDPYHMGFSAGILKGFDDPRSIYRSDAEINEVFSINAVDTGAVL